MNIFERLKLYAYRIGLKIRGAKLNYPIRGNNFLFGNVRGLKNGAYIMLETGVKLNISGDNSVLTIGDYVYINSYPWWCYS